MNDHDGKDEAIARRAKALFDDSVERLEAASLSRLNRSRQRALASLAAGPAPSWMPWLPATGVVAVAVVTAVMLNRPEAPAMPPVESPSSTDIELLLGEDSLEMLEELEFYSWMEPGDLEPDGNVG